MAVEIAGELAAKEVVAAAVEAQVGTAVEVAWAASAEPGAMVVAVAGMVGVEGLVVAKAALAARAEAQVVLVAKAARVARVGRAARVEDMGGRRTSGDGCRP